MEIIGPHKDDAPLLARLETQAERFGLSMKVENVVPDRWLEEGDTVSFPAMSSRCCIAPAMLRPCRLCNRAQNFAHLGDVLFHGSIGRTDLPGGNHQQLLDSIRTKILPLGDEMGFICGHGPGRPHWRGAAQHPYLRGL